MGIFDALRDSIGGVVADQWKDIVTCGEFNEQTLVAPGMRRHSQDGQGNNRGTDNILSRGSIIQVPENTAAFIFSQGGIEQVVTEPGGYVYADGQATVLAGDGVGKALVGQTLERFGFSGMTPDEKRVAFLNLREIRNIKFGTRGPLVYHDRHYGTDLEVHAFGTFSVQVADPERCVRGFVPANADFYALDMFEARCQLVAELLHSFAAAVNALSESCRVSQLPSQADAVAAAVRCDTGNVGGWEERFGLRLASIALENIELSDASRELVNQFSAKKMSVMAYEGVSQRAADIAAQQLIAQGVRDNGLGDGGGMLFGMNLAQGLRPRDAAWVGGEPAGSTDGEGDGASRNDRGGVGQDERLSLSEQIEALEKLKGLVDAGILTQEEFEAKKHSVLGIA